MKITLRTMAGNERSFDVVESLEVTPAPIPCFRCGVCCERWQPLIDKETVHRIAVELGYSDEAFRQEYTRPYPLHDEQWLIRQSDSGACAFLQYDDDGISGCQIHAVRPDACRDWEASLQKKECQMGLLRWPSAGSLLLPEGLFPEPATRTEFFDALSRGTK